ncbi:MAG: GDP-mannose 4,6-dehydratase [Candidatus Obscuribacterales bacterium]|nr:GDP-mannose 4,6-dehydratase [Candidatus Obscuribacterales bacterium]
MKNFWTDRRTLVTGATGLLGSWLCKSLLEKGAEPVCLVRDWVPQSELMRAGVFDRCRVVRGDLCDLEFIERVLAEYEIETVFNLAAQTIVTIANASPLSTFESNIRGTWILLEACRRVPFVKQIVTASSDKAYGEQKVLPYKEDMPLQGQHPYDVSKSAADLIAHSFAHSYKLPVAITRCGNFYGGGDLNWNRIVPGTIRSVVRGDAPIIRSDGKFLRDYIYVEDGADACILLAEKLAENPELAGEAFNFSTESPLDVIQLVTQILKQMNSNLEPQILSKASNEIRDQYLSSEKARKMLGWQPRYSLEEALARTINWYVEYFQSEGTNAVSVPQLV